VSRLRPTLAFIAGWALLDAMVSVRYPAPEPAFWFLLPAVDVMVIFTYFGLFAWFGWRVPKLGRVALVALLLFVRLLRIGDGVEERYYAQPFHLHTDLALFPELIRFSYASLGFWLASLALLAGALGIVLACVACYAALEHAERYLAERKNVVVVGSIAAVCFSGVMLGKKAVVHEHLYDLGFAKSAVPRIKREAKMALNAVSENAELAAAVARQQELLRRTPSDLGRLGGKNVYLFLIESYGETVLDRAEFRRLADPIFDAYEAELGARGFGIVSGRLDSSTYGGRSWLAHASLGTGVRVENQLAYEVVCDKKPRAMASFFRAAGYRTVLVQPATTRAWPDGEFYGFEQKYYFWNFDYAGPSYAWATMPDQYVVDFIRRRELAKEQPRPLFVQYVLVTSHAPWSELPPLVDDWDRIGNGALFNRLPRRRYPIEWPNFDTASGAYIDSIVYDLELLKRYIRDFVSDDSLIILVGDHQPVAEVNGHSASHGVPIHVLSRDPALLEPFARRGHVRGMRPPPKPPYAGLETLLVSLLTDFSTPR
jgi:hypothetical protein